MEATLPRMRIALAAILAAASLTTPARAATADTGTWTGTGTVTGGWAVPLPVPGDRFVTLRGHVGTVLGRGGDCSIVFAWEDPSGTLAGVAQGLQTLSCDGDLAPWSGPCAWLRVATLHLVCLAADGGITEGEVVIVPNEVPVVSTVTFAGVLTHAAAG